MDTPFATLALWWRRSIAKEIILIVVLGAILGVHFALAGTLSDQILLGVGVTLGMLPVFGSAVKALIKREWASMDMLASMALLFALIEREWASALFITMMLASARLLEKATGERTERSIRGLLNLRPQTAKVERGETFEVVAADDLVVGDRVLIDVGERIPVDGVVLAGAGSIDESSLSGESLPVDKEAGSSVSSSTLVTSGSLRVETTRVGRDTTLERIIALVESSQAEKPQIETLGNRFGKAYLILIFVGSALLLALTRDLTLVLSVVLVVCADDVAIAIPLAYLRAIGAAAKRGVIIKGGRHLETFGKANIMVFDKTGTLTLGKPRVSGIALAADVSESSFLQVAGLAAKRSTHPFSKAIVGLAAERGLSLAGAETAEVFGGKGIVATQADVTVVLGKADFLQAHGCVLPVSLEQDAQQRSRIGESVSWVARDQAVIGFFSFADEIKAETLTALQSLRELGVQRLVMLSGDNERVAAALAEKLGFDEWHANLLPEDKVARLKVLNTEGVVAMVGDGVNDAAALSLAHVGIAMGGLGADGAIESANIVLMRDDLSTLPETMRLARSVRRISVQDFFIWGTTNLFGLLLVFTGVIGPPGAAAYNFLSDFFPLFNSMRVKLPRQTR